AAAVGVDLEHRANTGTAATKRRPIQRAAGERQARIRIRAVAAACEVLEHGVAAPVSVDLEHRPYAGTAAILRRPIQRAAGERQVRRRICTVAAVEALEDGVAAPIGVD